jgi:hypothetical protein
MSNPDIARWRQRGKVYLWRFPDKVRNYPGWDCTADPDGCRSLSELLRLIASSERSAKLDIALTAPNLEIVSLPGLPPGDRWSSPDRLALHYPGIKVDADLWRWSGDLLTPTLSLGRSMIFTLIDAFEAVGKGVGDFCVHHPDVGLHGLDFETMSIWFW